jgi:hypothetical protein
MRAHALLLAGAGLLTAVLAPAWGAPPPTTKPTATFGVYPSISSGGIPATHNAAAVFWEYFYTVPVGGSINDTIPIQVCIDNSTLGVDALGAPVAWSDDVVTAVNGGLNGVTVASPPWSFNSSQWNDSNPAPQGCQNGTITIATGPLTSTGIAASNIKFSNDNKNPASGGTMLQDGFDTPIQGGQVNPEIHIRANVVPAGGNLTCFLTDSSGNLLLQADGITPASASGDTSGTFAIVLNAKKKAVSTNPGQFYFNLLWNNSGAQTSALVQFAEGGTPPFVTNGVQANHWAVFTTSGFAGVTPPNFDLVNEGNPAGKLASFTANPVPVLNTLYATRHLEWSGLGTVNPATPVFVTVTGTVTPASTGTPISCTAGATGTLKQ